MVTKPAFVVKEKTFTVTKPHFIITEKEKHGHDSSDDSSESSSSTTDGEVSHFSSLYDRVKAKNNSSKGKKHQ